VFGRIIGYGYNPGRAFWVSVAWVLLASLVFWKARQKGWLEEVTEKDESPPADTRWTAEDVARQRESAAKPEAKHYWLETLPFSIEKFIPIVTFGLAHRWKPKEIRGGGDIRGAVFIQVFTWAHIIAGWILASLWVGALTGLAK
jgi:hypothetical protein